MSYQLIEIAAQVTRWTVPVILTLGITANFLNVVILRRANLKRHSCSLYFVTLSINNLVYITICITTNLLTDGFGISLDSYSNAFCKFNTYLLNLCPQMSLSMLILASIDRFCSSSADARRRRLSSIRTAQWSILFVLLCTAVFMLGYAIMTNNINDRKQCTFFTDSLLSQIHRTIQALIYVIVSPLLMIVFGLLTIHNTTQFGRNHLGAFRHRRNEKQLARMLIYQVSAHLLLSLPFCVIFFITIIPVSFTSSIVFYFLFLIFKIPIYITFITPFFLYILSAQIYRNELIVVLRNAIPHRRNRVVHLTRTQPATIQMNTMH